MVQLLYYVELARYGLGNSLLFSKRIKRWWLPLLIGLLFFLFNVTVAEYIEPETKYLISYTMAVMTAVLMLDEKLVQKIICILSMLCVFTSIDEVIGIVLSYAADDRIYSAEEKCIFEEVIIIGILLLLNLIKIIAKKRWKRNIQLQYNTAIIGIIIINFCLLAFGGGLFFLSDNDLYKENRVYMEMLGLLIYGCVISFVLFTLYTKRVNDKLEQLIETEHRLSDMQKEYYIALLEQEESTRKYRHDLNNHIICLDGLLRKECYSEVHEYIRELKGNLVSIKKRNYATGNEILDILFNHQLAGKEAAVDIGITGYCKRQLNISNVDLCIIVSNLLKNALEELQRGGYEKKYIRINMKTGKEYFMLVICNPSGICIEKSGMRTSKTDKRNHGFGIKNVQETVEKNGGSFSLSGNGKEVFAKVVLNIKK